MLSGCAAVGVPLWVLVLLLGLSTEDVEMVAEVVTLCMSKHFRAWPFGCGCGRGPGCGKSSGVVCSS